MNKKGDLYFSDLPIESKSDDILNRYRFVSQVSKSILNWKTEDSLVLGLFGGWGDGKTSVLNLLKGELIKNYQILFFDPWYFDNQKDLLKKFLQEVFSLVYKQLPEISAKRMEETIKKFIRKISSLPISISVPGLSYKLSDFKLSDPTLAELHKEIFDLIKNQNRKNKTKYLVLIDNLDRLPPDEIIMLIKLVRLCSTFPYMVFILSFDFDYVAKAIDNKLFGYQQSKIGVEYLSKILQTSIQLPTIDFDCIDEFFNDAFLRIQKYFHFEWPADFLNRFPQFYQRYVRGNIIKNLRDAKKIANSSAFTFPLIKDELNYADWLVMEIVRVLLPDLYTLIRENIDTLAPPIESINVNAFQNDLDQLMKKFKLITEKIESMNLSPGLKVLEFLFPVYATWRTNPTNLPREHGDLYTDLLRNQRIASPDYMYRFFLFGPPRTELQDSRVTSFISRINSTTKPKLFENFSSELEKYKASHQLKILLDKLVIHSDKFKQTLIKDIAIVVSKISKMFSDEKTAFMDSEDDRAQALIFSLINNHDKSTNPTEILKSCIESSKSWCNILSVNC